MELRRRAVREGISHKVLENQIDELWGHVTLYNAYQFFVALSSKKSHEEDKILIDPEMWKEWCELKEGYERASLIDPTAQKPTLKLDDKDFLTLFFDATNQLPKNSIRTLAGNADGALRAMGGSEKTIASVYGIALTAMVRLCSHLKRMCGRSAKLMIR